MKSHFNTQPSIRFAFPALVTALIVIWFAGMAELGWTNYLNIGSIPFTKNKDWGSLAMAEDHLAMICHRQPSKSFWISDVPMGLCSRCTTVYFSLLLVGLMGPLLIRCIRRKGAILAVLFAFVMPIDGFLQHYGVYHTGNLLRGLTGLVFGIAIGTVCMFAVRRILLWSLDIYNQHEGKMNSRKRLLHTAISTLLAVTTFWMYVLHPPLSFAQAKKVKLEAGTVIVLVTDREVNSDAPAGEVVDFSVIREVKVDDQTVIKTGTKVTGVVSEVQSNGAVGSPGKVIVKVQSVPAVDGKRILLRGSVERQGEGKVAVAVIAGLLCLPLFLIRGESAVVPVGTEVRVYTEEDYMIAIGETEKTKLPEAQNTVLPPEKPVSGDAVQYAGTGSDHYIKKIMDNGALIILDDGSMWEVLAKDAAISSKWENATLIAVTKSKGKYPYFMIDVNQNQGVAVRYVGQRFN